MSGGGVLGFGDLNGTRSVSFVTRVSDGRPMWDEVIVAVLAQTPIAGVSAGQDRIVEISYPSVAALSLGRLIGLICESIPAQVCHIPVSYLLFALPLAPLGAALYLLQKVFGSRYLVTNRGVEIRSSIGARLVKRVELADIAEITCKVHSGQAFHHAADVELRNAKGSVLATLAGVSRPERLRSAILEIRDARMSNDAALAQIQARK